MRLTDFWGRLEGRLGAAYADSFARDFVIAGLGGRTAREALESGMDAKLVWRAVCEVLDIPPSQR